ncbi:PQQ-binding-like beta-propeller repeat protein [Spiroplasma endosymbiont of Agriotes lineatus]|uniref:YncE family protein n=1 Tax=Spiroplasma endosymbiont of Agriotes lineatus TaxID=3077930 RepID=UPI0030CCB4DB
MKKFLEILGIITIAGSGISGIVANSPYQKQKTNLESINYKRQKRSNNENNRINRTKIVIRTNCAIFFNEINLNNKLYFSSRGGNIYEYDPATGKQKIVIRTNNQIWYSGVVLNNKLYFVSDDNNVYEYDPVTNQQKIVIRTNDKVWSSGMVFNNKLYFGSDDNNVYEYDPATGKQKIVIRTNDKVWSSGVVFNNKIYFGSLDNNVYEYDPVTNQQKIVIRTNDKVWSSGIVFNNKLYFGSWDHNVYEYSEYYLNSNLGKINDNSDKAILNELNYLNPDLDISQLEIINKTNNSAIVKIKDNLNNDNNIKIHYSIDNQQNKIINLNKLIKKVIFFKFRDEKQNLIFKEIKNINIDNLMFSTIEVTSASDSLKSIDEKAVCFEPVNFPNISSNIQKIKIPSCSYEAKAKYLFQITTGLNINNSKNITNGWNLNIDDEMILTDFTIWNKKTSEIKNTLSKDFDLSNINKQEQELILNRDLLHSPEQELSVDPKQRLIAQYVIRLLSIKTNLYLKQKINGTITAKIIDDNNKEQTITLSITEAM